MKIKGKTVLMLLIILFLLSFFFTPVGFEGKILLNRLFASSPKIIEADNRFSIKDYNWKLKDANWDFFNFDESKGKVVFINFWASWKVPSVAELSSIQKLYDDYKDKVIFYIITNEEREPVEELMQKRDYTFPVTYLIIGEKTPFSSTKVHTSYVLDKKGNIVIQQEGVANWNSKKVRETLDELLKG